MSSPDRDDEPVDEPRPSPPHATVVDHGGWHDVDEVVTLIRRVEEERLGDAHTRPEDVRRRWLDLVDLGDTLLVRGTDDQLLGYAEFHAHVDPDAPVPDLFFDGQVAPEAVGRGIATHLLDRAVARAREVAHGAGRDAVVLETMVRDGDDRARAFFRRRGFTPYRHLLDLRLELGGDLPVPHWPEGVRSRPVVLEDEVETAWRVHQRAFADVATHLPMTLDDFVASRIAGDPGHEPQLWRFAEATADEEPIAIVIARTESPGAAEAGWVRDLGVVPEQRRRGVALALLREMIQLLAERGCSAVQLEVDDVSMDGAVELYRRAGMRIVRRTDLLARHIEV